MKILLANKFYYNRGGDCICTINLEELLKQNGHEVAVFAMQYPKNLETQWSKYFPCEIEFSSGLRMFEAIRRPFGTSEVKRKFTTLLDDFQPDVVHLHNIHSYLSPVIAEIAHKRGIRVVWTLHDLKLLCPRYDCLRKGETICEECSSNKYKVVSYKCMKNNRVASFLAYWEAKKWAREKLETYTDLFISPSQFLANKMIQGKFDETKIKVLCNFIDIEKCVRNSYDKEFYYCYVGRLSNEKGVKALIEVANKLPYQLKIIGSGPLAGELQQQAKGHIEFVGHKQWDEIKQLVGNARFSVIPSECYENNPLSVIEALCLGTPVLGARIGGIPELISEGITGLCFENRNVVDLKNKIERMFEMPFNYESIANHAQKRFNSDQYFDQIISLYQSK